MSKIGNEAKLILALANAKLLDYKRRVANKEFGSDTQFIRGINIALAEVDRTYAAIVKEIQAQ